jgi:hypothetical protein
VRTGLGSLLDRASDGAGTRLRGGQTRNRTRFGRRLDKAGYARFRHWRVYAEQGLAGEHVAVWLYAENLTVEFADEALARYSVAYARPSAVYGNDSGFLC